MRITGKENLVIKINLAKEGYAGLKGENIAVYQETIGDDTLDIYLRANEEEEE